jgi:hypothetical protein
LALFAACADAAAMTANEEHKRSIIAMAETLKRLASVRSIPIRQSKHSPVAAPK